MAAGKVQYIFRQLPAITGSSWNAGVLTVNFAAAHQLIAGNTFRVNGAGTQNFTTTVYTVAGVAGNNVTITMASQPPLSFDLTGQNSETTYLNTGSIVIGTFGASNTQSTIVMQAISTGPNSSSLSMSVSLDGVHWITGPTGTVPGNGTLSDTTVHPNWAYYKIDGSGIGASTSIQILKSC